MLRPKIWKRVEFKEGKGFSQRELKSAGLSLQEARKLGVAVDARRRSKYEENVTVLLDLKAKALKAEEERKKAAERRAAKAERERKAVKKPAKKKPVKGTGRGVKKSEKKTGKA